MRRLVNFLVCMYKISPIVWENVYRNRDIRCTLGFHDYVNALWYGSDQICRRCYQPPPQTKKAPPRS